MSYKQSEITFASMITDQWYQVLYTSVALLHDRRRLKKQRMTNNLQGLIDYTKIRNFLTNKSSYLSQSL
jgi:hypothetical protein